MASGGLMKAMRSFKKPATAAPSGETTGKAMQSGRGRTTAGLQAPKGENQLGNMSAWDKFIYGQNQGGQDRWAADNATINANNERWKRNNADLLAQQKADEEKKRDQEAQLKEQGYGSAYDNPFTAGATAQSLWGQAFNATMTGDDSGFDSTLKSLTPPADATEAKADMDKADVRADWATSLGNSNIQTKELTWDEYDALSPQQRAAVDGNTLLVNAIRADLSAGVQAADAEDEGYSESLKALFGDEGGSDTYAPQTVAALQQLGLEDTERGDLDNYLSQAALLDNEDIRQIGTGDFSQTARGEQAQLFSERALSSINETLSSGYGLLSGVGAADPRSTELNDLFEMLSTRGNYDQLQDTDVSEIMGMFLAENPSIDQRTLTRYFEDRLNAYDYGIAAGQTPSMGMGDAAQYVTPAEFRGRYYSNGG